MTDSPKQLNNREVLKVEAKPVETERKLLALPKANVSIGKLTLNIFTEPLKKRYAKHYKKEKVYLITDILLAVIVIILLAALANIWFFSKTTKIHQMDFVVASTPADLINGQETEFTIDYKNKTNDTLSGVNLILKTPASLQDPQYDQEGFNLKTNTLDIGDLAGQAHGQLKVKGFLLGNYNEKQEFIAVMNYKNKYGQSRQEFFNQEFQLADSVLKTQINLPPKIIASAKFETQLTLGNTFNSNFSQTKIKMFWPAGYNLKSADLGETISEQTWLIGDLSAGMQKTASFIGRISKTQPQEIKIGAEVWTTYKQKEYLIAKTEASALLDLSKLELTFINQENSRHVAPGGEATYTLHYQNKENYALTNVEISLDISGDYAGSINPANFTQNKYPQLKQMEPNGEGSFEVKAKTKSNIDFPAYRENGYQLEARITAGYDDPIQKSRISLESEPLYTLVDSRLSLKTLGIFYTEQGDQIGVGSVPPIVGEYTSYWAIIQINNTSNKIKDLKITAKVPAGIEFTNIYNVTDGNQISFNDQTRLLTWNIDAVSAFAGIFNPAPEARIQLAITPTSSQTGSSPALLTNISATATDAVTNAFLSANGKDISIAIFADESLNNVSE